MKRTLQTTLATIITLLGCFQTIMAQWSVKGEPIDKNVDWHLFQRFTPQEWDASNFATEGEMEWFKNARYGMFIHFGLSTYKEKDLSWGICATRKAPDRGKGPYPYDVWTKWPEEFEFDKFDAKQWIEIAKKSGIKYIVAIAKHHDGFHLWDTEYSSFKVTNTPYGKDYLKELANACHAVGMKFGIYYSQRDWYHSDYAPVDTLLIEEFSEVPYFKLRQGVQQPKPGSSHKKYIDYQFNAVHELCTNYGKIDIFWFDASWWGGMFTAEMWDSEKLTRMIRKLQPGIIINNRASIPGDFDTPEQKIGMHQFRPWESCITLCQSWSWSPTPVKSKKTLIDMLTGTACGNGNLLLSWGPKWDGAFDPTQIERLMEVGSWLKKFGHTIYDTRSGPWYPMKWGGTTRKGNKAFVHIIVAPEKELVLPPINNKILKAKTLTGGRVGFRQNQSGVVLELQNIETVVESIIIELTFENEIISMVDGKAW